MTGEPDQSGIPETTGERDGLGRFVQGNQTSRLGGRPKSLHLLTLLDSADAEMTPSQRVVWVFRLLCEAAEEGDVSAQREILARLCGPIPSKVAIGGDEDGVPLQLSEATVANRLASILAIASARKVGGA